MKLLHPLSALDSTRFRVRLNCVDHYQASPSAFDPPLFGRHGSTQQQSSSSPTVPVIRVFGSTETGQKVCAHIHGALPYLFIEYNGRLDKDAVDSYIHQLRASIDHALAVSYRRNLYDGKTIFVAHISLVRGIPFFGYHVGYRHFLKIYMLNPLNMTRFADLLYQGAIMKQVLQPYESHLQYLLQWMCDFNLYGCAYIECDKYKFRGPLPDYFEMSSTRHRWHTSSVPAALVSDPTELQKLSHCSLEVDICVQDILNRSQVHLRDLHADFVERFGPSNPDEKLVRSLAGLWKDETRRRKLRMGLDDHGSSPFPPEVLVTMSADPRGSDKAGWIHEDEYRERVMRLVEEEQSRTDANAAKLTFEDFVKPKPGDMSVRTVLESVEDLFPENLPSSFDPTKSGPEHEPAFDNIRSDEALVDESYIHLLADEDLPYDSDEEVAREVALTQADEESKVVARADTTVASKPEDREGRKSANDAPKDRQSVGPVKRSLPNGLGENIDRGNEQFPSELSKRRRLSHPSDESPSSGQVQPHTQEATTDQQTDSQEQASQPRQLTGSQHSSLPLSQSSIKAKLDKTSGPSSFPVTKNPGSFTIPSHQKSDASSASPQKPRTASATSLPGKLIISPSTVSPFSLPQKPSQLMQKVASKYNAQPGTTSTCLIFGSAPPSSKDLKQSMFSLGYDDVIYQDAYYSNEKDVPDRARDYAGREFKLESDTLPFLPSFDPTGTSLASRGAKVPVVVNHAKEEAAHRKRRVRCRLRNWELAERPPSWQDVKQWLQTNEPNNAGPGQQEEGVEAEEALPRQHLSQIDGPTQHGQHGFKYSQKHASTSVRHETQYMSVMSLEVHVNTRDQFVPNPEFDEIACVFWCIQSDGDDEGDSSSGSHIDGLRVGIVCLSQSKDVANRIARETNVNVECETNELDLINRMVDIVREYDPDVLTGFEVHNGSWGYIIERARIQFEYNLCDEFSRMVSQSHGRFGKDADRWGFNTTSTIRVTGRHMINVWRAMRSELNLLQYTMENIAFHLLHKRIPHYHFKDLTEWYKNDKPRDLAKVVNYYLSRTRLNLEILDAQELIPRTSEQARLIGVDFFSVFSRGSQFKVESFMFRIAKPENFLLVSPSRKQVGQQNALECLPLVMEPQSSFYPSPLLVLDFQSLYPSIMIAYNYCYSTCLGRTVSWRGGNKMGFADFVRQPGLLELVKDQINIAPNGMMYVKPAMRKSLLAKMLGEILETRVMVKSGMKVDKQDKTLQQLLNNRQLALKLLANVTYGYTSASFSGRMPCAEIADSIVQTGRETLEKAIAFIHSVQKWGAEVVYGDTDSLFVYLKGRTRADAFRIGNEIAAEVTKMNPRPVKLKFEKVYHPCVLLAKKRYVGFKYESPNQTTPEFDAKGIETVRRDGNPAEQKIEEKALKILFRTADLSQVKRYFLRQCTKIMAGKVSVQDFCFAREVRLGSYADKGPPPPGALISTRRMAADPRTEPQYGERVPYVVATGAPGARLIDRCIAPEALLAQEGAQLDADYYITKTLIPPLERIFNLVGANVRAWFDDMPKIQRVRDMAPLDAAATGQVISARRTLEGYMRASHCAVCRAKLPPPARGAPHHAAEAPLCAECAGTPSTALFALRVRLREAQARSADVQRVCRSCAGLSFGDEVRCDSKDCPVFYSRVKAATREARVRGVVESATAVLEGELGVLEVEREE